MVKNATLLRTTLSQVVVDFSEKILNMNEYKFAAFTIHNVSVADITPLHPLPNNGLLCEAFIDNNEMSSIDSTIIDKINKHLAKDIHTRILSVSSFKSIIPNKAEIIIERGTTYKPPPRNNGKLDVSYEAIKDLDDNVSYKGGIIDIDVAVCYKVYDDCIELYNYSFIDVHFDKSSKFVTFSDSVFFLID